MDEVLTEIAKGLGDIDSLDELLPFVLGKAAQMFSAERAMFAVCDPEGHIRRATRFNMPLGEDGRLPISDSLVHEVLERHRSVIVRDTESSIDYNARESVKLNNIRAMMGVPVMSASRLMGVLYIDSTTKQYFGRTYDGQRQLEGLAGLVSLAMRHIEVSEEQKYRERFIEAVVHNIRNTLQVMSTNVDELQHRSRTADVTELTDALRGSIDSLNAVSTSVLELYKLQTARTSPTVWIDPAVEMQQRMRSLERFARTVTRQDLRLEFTEAPMISTDAARFGMVVDELLLNAIKYSGPDHPVVVSVAVTEAGRSAPEDLEHAGVRMHRLPRLKPIEGTPFVQFSITNANREGRIPDDVLRKIFEPYVRADQTWTHYSSGLGLSVVRELVTSLGGDVWAESDDRLTTFHFDLPTRAEIVEF